ncbi:hypothetical protein FOZ63_010389, partial [Perkinsus olseni]
DGDLAFLIYGNDNSLTTYFRNKEILFMKVTQTWSPGKFVYRSSTRPKVKRVYKAACLEWRNTASAAAARRAALARNGLRHRPRDEVHLMNTFMKMNFIFTTALEPGTYIYEAVDCTITYRVEADLKAIFTLKTHVKPGPWAAVDFLTTFTLPPVPLVSDDGNKTYSYSLRRAVPPRTIHDLFTGVRLAFRGAFWITPVDDSFPPAGTKDGDFTVITYETPYAISINFRGKPIILVRNGRNAVAGKYVYRSSTHPRFKLAYRIRRDGSVRIRAK